MARGRPVTVAALLDAAGELFAERGFGATSIPDICARAGLTKGALYSNFASKEALFLALFDRFTDRLIARIEEALAPAQSLQDGLARVRDVVSDRQSRQWFLVSMEFTLHAIRHPAIAATLLQHETRTQERFAAMLAAALARAGRQATIPLTDLARIVIAVAEGSDTQTLVEIAANGTAVEPRVHSLATPVLLHSFSQEMGNSDRR
jgi:AcrR family transcriptional regulator